MRVRAIVLNGYALAGPSIGVRVRGFPRRRPAARAECQSGTTALRRREERLQSVESDASQAE